MKMVVYIPSVINCRKRHINIFHYSKSVLPLIFCHRPTTHRGHRMFLSIFCLLSIMLIFVFPHVKVLPPSVVASQDPNILINNNSGDHDHGIKTEVVRSSWLYLLSASLFESLRCSAIFDNFLYCQINFGSAKNMRIVAKILLQTLPLYVFLTNSTFRVKHAAVENF